MTGPEPRAPEAAQIEAFVLWAAQDGTQAGVIELAISKNSSRWRDFQAGRADGGA